MKYNFRLFIFLVTALISTKVSASQSGGGNNQAIPLPQVSAQIQAAHNFANFCASCHRDDLSWFAKRKWKYGKGIGDGFAGLGKPVTTKMRCPALDKVDAS